MNVRYRVELSQTEREQLMTLLSGGRHAVRRLKRAQILLAADARASDEDIATSLGTSGSTVYRTKQRFLLGNLEAALSEQPRPGASRKLSGKEEALLVATACCKLPQGRARRIQVRSAWRLPASGPPQHVAGEQFKMMAGVDLVHVPYRGNGPALTDLLSGQVQVLFASAPSSIEYVRAGKLRALAVTTARRLEALPDIPTVGEFVSGYEASTWYGLGAPR